MTDFESRMNAILAAITWTNAGSQPSTHLGKIKTHGKPRDNSVRATNDDVETFLTGSGGVAYKKIRGTLEGWSDTETKRDNIESDLIAGLPGQGAYIREINRLPRKKNKFRFEMRIELIV